MLKVSAAETRHDANISDDKILSTIQFPPRSVLSFQVNDESFKILFIECELTKDISGFIVRMK